MEVNEKYKKLKNQLINLGSCMVAFSGGLDSTFLLKVAQEALGDNIIAVTIVAPYTPTWERDEAIEVTTKFGIKHELIEIPIIDRIKYNPEDRCYWCKKNMFSMIKDKASSLGYEYIIDGTNEDDLRDYRPGLKALRELGIISPLFFHGFTKEDIRKISKKNKIPLWDKPPYSCLLTRIPHGNEIKRQELDKIEQSERYLMGIGFKAIRVRCHGNLARIEFARGDRKKLFDDMLLDTISKKLKEYGFKYVSMELEGYSMGSMNQEEELQYYGDAMDMKDLKNLLENVKSGIISVDDGVNRLRDFSYTDLGHAKIDNNREVRVGYPEVIYCPGKTVTQIKEIIQHMLTRDTNILATRATGEIFNEVKELCGDAVYNELAGTITIKRKKVEISDSYIAVITAGTSDLPVAEEAVVTLDVLGSKAQKIVDVGVAGIHRLFDKLDLIRNARVIIVVAGMEGALASVVAGLVDKPVVAVPTSVGYGSSFGGLAALLTMLNSCSGGVCVVNIDNGFGAACVANMINKL